MYGRPLPQGSLPQTTSSSYRRQKTTGNHLVRAKLPDTGNVRSKRKLPGMYKCRNYGRECSICPWILETKVAAATNSHYKLDITSHLTCQSENVIYVIVCTKCNVQYVGETDRSLKDRFNEHKGYVRTKKLNMTTGAHFNLPGHSVSDMLVMAIQKIFNKDTPYRKELEKEMISNFNTFHRGLNKTPGG